MAGECFGEAWDIESIWGMLGNAPAKLGDSQEVWGRFGECSMDALRSLGGLQHITIHIITSSRFYQQRVCSLQGEANSNMSILVLAFLFSNNKASNFNTQA